ncbi:MAG: selenium cofactor biosynthesis protein YqeC [Ruthenibacterium sp.]
MLLDILLPPNVPRKIVCVAGAGGKTTLITTLAREAKAQNLRCAIATTTHYYAFSQTDFYDGSGNSAAQLDAVRTQLELGNVVYTGTPTGERKLCACGNAMWQTLLSHSDTVLIEADGSSRLPIKFPRAGEPVLPPHTDAILVVMGLSALGKKLCDVCHRYPLVCDALSCAPDVLVTPALLAQIVTRGYGDLPQMQAVLNQADVCPPALAAETQALLSAHFKTHLISAQKGCCSCSF